MTKTFKWKEYYKCCDERGLFVGERRDHHDIVNLFFIFMGSAKLLYGRINKKERHNGLASLF